MTRAQKLISQLEKIDKDKEKIFTEVDGETPHKHEVIVDDDGDGHTGPADNGPKHSHKIINWDVHPAGKSDKKDPNHVHQIDKIHKQDLDPKAVELDEN